MASSESRTVVILALIANSIIAVLKFVAAAISGSTAMLAEGFHSVADSGNQLFLLRGTSASKIAPSVRFSFGRGKEAYFWSFMVAVVLFVAGGVVAILEGYERLRHPEHHEGGIVLNLVVLGLAAFFEIVIAFRPALEEFNRRRRGRGAWRTIRESKDPTLVVVLFEDTVAVLGVFIAAAGLILAEVTGASQWDGAASIVIGIMLTATAWLLALETKGLLLGESASRRTRSEIRGAILSLGSVETVERLMTMHLGSEEILVNVDVTVEDGFSGDQVEGVVADIEEAIRSVVPEATRIFVEVGADS